MAPAAPTGEIHVPAGRSGDASSGARLASARCGSCHGSTAAALDPRRYTAEQWSRYFETDRHRRRAPLGDTFSVPQLADVKAFLMSRAADVRAARAAGVH
ncbi:MAG: cytochrome c [Sandaracinus sp.]|nr:cytochrome c [Sandaracinus sp.]MCB9615499.1 cytochrome c [Sandaracinus sp.]MCB9617911.1 cytochrome c [Sandaracinus sp.]MCB9623694.1 cytochrome c [Sandaracinus sp.]MCB9634486.1 cytochrome c [Sandaracinus sp.]